MLVKLRTTVIKEREIEVASLAEAEKIRAREEQDERDWHQPTGEQVTIEIAAVNGIETLVYRCPVCTAWTNKPHLEHEEPAPRGESEER